MNYLDQALRPGYKSPILEIRNLYLNQKSNCGSYLYFIFRLTSIYVDNSFDRPLDAQTRRGFDVSNLFIFRLSSVKCIWPAWPSTGCSSPRTPSFFWLIKKGALLIANESRFRSPPASQWVALPLVDPRGVEPPASSLQMKRSTGELRAHALSNNAKKETNHKYYFLLVSSCLFLFKKLSDATLESPPSLEVQAGDLDGVVSRDQHWR